MIQNVLIVCIGNICRSPIGAAMFSDRLQSIVPKISVQSAGLSALVGHAADLYAREVVEPYGLDLTYHRARQFTTEMALAADLILTMDFEQQTHILSQLPNVCGRVHRLGKWSDVNIPDPFQRPKVIFEQVLGLIEQSVNEWCERLWT